MWPCIFTNLISVAVIRKEKIFKDAGVCSAMENGECH